MQQITDQFSFVTIWQALMKQFLSIDGREKIIPNDTIMMIPHPFVDNIPSRSLTRIDIYTIRLLKLIYN